MLDIIFAAKSDVGIKRTNNEDSFGYFISSDEDQLAKKGSLFIVADGMGGHDAGEVASELAVNTITEIFKKEKNEDINHFFERAYYRANSTILESSVEDGNKKSMGTTCTAVVVKDDYVYAANIGDSRAYHIRDGNIHQLTNDHSLVWEMAKLGIISKEEMRTHPKRNVIMRALGVNESVEVECMSPPLKLMENDHLILCSDGLSEMVIDEEIEKVVSNRAPDKACSKLIEMANKNGGKDNITIIVMKAEL